MNYAGEVKDILSALSDVDRVRCLSLVCEGKRPSEIARELGKQRSTIQRYMETYQDAKLIDTTGKATIRASRLVKIMLRLIEDLDRELVSIKKEELPTASRFALEELLREAPKLGFHRKQIATLEEAKRLLDSPEV